MLAYAVRRRLILQYLSEGSSGQSAALRLASYPASMGMHKPPFCCLAPWQMGTEFVTKCKTGVFQYVVVRFINTILTTILFTLGLYEEGKYSVAKPFIWMTAVNFCSQSWALYSLFLFFLCAHKELHGMRPFSKFLCIKLIIFFSWWQGLIIGILVRVGHIQRGYGHSAQEMAVLFRCTLMSAEMVIAAIAFMHAFPVSEFISGANVRKASGGLKKVSSKSIMKLLAGYNVLGRVAKMERAEAGQAGQDTTAAMCSAGANSIADQVMQYWGTTNAAPAGAAVASQGTAEQLELGAMRGRESGNEKMRPLEAGEVDGSLARDSEHGQALEVGGSSCDSLDALLVRRNSCAGRESIGLAGVGTSSEPPAAAVRETGLAASPAQKIQRPRYAYGKAAELALDAPQLTLRASPHLFRREASPVGKNFKNVAPFPTTPSGQSRRAGQLTSRDLSRDFMGAGGGRREAEEAIQDSSTNSECSHDESGSGASQSDAACVDSTRLAAITSLAHTASSERLLSGASVPSREGRTRARSGSKGHRSTERVGASSPWLEALWMSTLPADLQEDLGDLGAELGMLYSAVLPLAQLNQVKRFIKSSNTNS
jgi:hypothetical protein